LRSVAEQLASGAGNIGLAISPELTLIVPAPDVVQDDLENENINEENQQEVSWSPVPLEFVLFDNESGSEIDQESGVEWHPRSIEYLVLFWCSVAAKDSIALTKPHEISNFDEHDWVREIAARRLALGAASGRPAPASIPDDPIISELIEIRSAFRAEAAISGLAEALLNDTFDRWQALVVKAKAEFVPDGAPDDRLSTFISSDCILGFGGDGILMLPSHPLRLRWIGLGKAGE
jgi:hypothetical protein